MKSVPKDYLLASLLGFAAMAGAQDLPSAQPLSNTENVQSEEAQIRALKNAYISPYNYTQDPIAYNMGTSAQAESSGTYHIGLSQVNTVNIPRKGQNLAKFDSIMEAWGQTGRVAGFALGGALTVANVFAQSGQPNSYNSTGVFAPTQAYLDYEYRDILELTAGSIILTNPWVNSTSSFPGATYSNENNTFMAINANLQVNPNLLLSGFRAFNYFQYPFDWYGNTTLYNTMGGTLSRNSGAETPGVAGVGALWNPDPRYKLNAWFYQFYDYADMWYLDTAYHLALTSDASIDFAVQALAQNSNGNSIAAASLLPKSTQPAGAVSGNAVGLKIGFNIPHNTLSLAYNNVFGTTNSYLNGGILTPYTYGLETDPLYTTPALNSLAELGSGSAYLIKDSLNFMDNHLKASVAFAQFFVNQVYPTQAKSTTEYDLALQYTVPGTNLNFWSRVAYVSKPDYAGGSFWQPRLIVNYNF